MKRLIIFLLTLFSLQSFSTAYEIVKNLNVKISKQEI